MQFYAGTYSFDDNGKHISLNLVSHVGQNDAPDTPISYIKPCPKRISDRTKRQFTLRTPNLKSLSADEAIRLLLSRGRTLEEVEAHEEKYGYEVMRKKDIGAYKEKHAPRILDVKEAEPEYTPKSASTQRRKKPIARKNSK